MIWTDGSKYEGEWVKGIQHGRGVMNMANGEKKEGYYDNNVYVGQITETDEVQEETEGSDEF